GVEVPVGGEGDDERVARVVGPERAEVAGGRYGRRRVADRPFGRALALRGDLADREGGAGVVRRRWGRLVRLALDRADVRRLNQTPLGAVDVPRDDDVVGRDAPAEDRPLARRVVAIALAVARL